MKSQKQYCPWCSGKLEPVLIENRERLRCTACGKILYQNPLPATCAVVFDRSGKILMTLRDVEPALGEWCLPGGFVEIDETPAECVLREVEEETGLVCEVIRSLGVEGQRSRLYTNVMVAGFLLESKGGELRPGDDARDAKWFEPKSAPAPTFSSHREILKRGLEIIREDIFSEE